MKTIALRVHEANEVTRFSCFKRSLALPFPFPVLRLGSRQFVSFTLTFFMLFFNSVSVVVFAVIVAVFA